MVTQLQLDRECQAETQTCRNDEKNEGIELEI